MTHVTANGGESSVKTENRKNRGKVIVQRDSAHHVVNCDLSAPKHRKIYVGLKEKLCIHLPFGVYLGWATIATIANIDVTLVSLGWNGFGLSLQTWAILVLAVALILDLVVLATRKDIAYSLVFIWAFVGIGFNQAANPPTVITAEIAITIITVALFDNGSFFTTP